jgi:hypothetical protein
MHTCLGGRNFTIDETRFKAGVHRLAVTFIGPYTVGPVGSITYQFTIRRKLMHCLEIRRDARKSIVAIIIL